MLFGRLHQRILLMCVPHVQHDYFSSFIQSYHCLLALLLALPLLSSFHKQPKRQLMPETFLSHGRQPEVRLFCYLTCLHIAVFTSLSTFSLVEAFSVKI